MIECVCLCVVGVVCFCVCACVSVFGGEILGSKRGNGTCNTLTGRIPGKAKHVQYHDLVAVLCSL